MKFKIDDAHIILNHVMLQDKGVAKAVSSTLMWKESEELEAILTINGVEIPAEVIEEFFRERYSMIEKALKTKYDADNIDNMVKDKAEKLLEERAGKLLEVMYNLQNTLENASTVIKPFWEE